jgi:ketosteroid isomerase-like protein
MSEESRTTDLVELTRQAFDAASRGDVDALMSLYAPEAVVALTELGTRFEGVPAIRGFYEDWIGTFEEWRAEPGRVLDLGNGVVSLAVVESGSPDGTDGRVEQREGWVFVWVDDLIVQVAAYIDADKARAAGERLAASMA